MMTKKNNWKAWAYLSPMLILMAIFTVYPIIRSTFISFDVKYNDYQDAFSWQMGFGNYTKLFQAGSVFPRALQNTMIIVFISVPISTVLALMIAVGLNSIKPLQKIFQTIFFTPYVTNTIAIGMVFAAIFNLDNGLMNIVLGWFGKDKLNWINDSNGVFQESYFRQMLVLQIYIIWNGLAFKILIFIGGLQNISKQYYDAAKIDATPRFRTLMRITIPLLSPMLIYIIITSFIGAFKTYDAVIGVFSSTSIANDKMVTVVGYIYQQISGGRYSLASAGAVVLLLIILVITGINSYISKKFVHYS